MSGKQSENAIVFFFNDAFFNYFKACLTSLKINYPEHPDLLVVYEGDSEVVEGFLEEQNTIRIRPGIPEADWSSCPDLIHPIVYRRFCLWSDFFDAYDKVLHLDADMLVLGSLDEVFESDDFFIVSNHEINARIFKPSYSEESGLHRLLGEDGLDYPDGMDDMANAGLFMIPRKYRTGEAFGRIRRLYERYGRFVAYADQSLISLWCLSQGIGYSTDYRLNYQTPMFQIAELDIDPDTIKVLHFSNRKPDSEDFMTWRLAKGHQHELRDLYEHYLAPGAASPMYLRGQSI